MKRKKKKQQFIPRFKSEREEQEFWGSRDSTQFMHELKALPAGEIQLDQKLARKIRERARKKHLIAVRLDDQQYSLAQKIAFKKSLGLSTLIRTWIAQGIWQELK